MEDRGHSGGCIACARRRWSSSEGAANNRNISPNIPIEAAQCACRLPLGNACKRRSCSGPTSAVRRNAALRGARPRQAPRKQLHQRSVACDGAQAKVRNMCGHPICACNAHSQAGWLCADNSQLDKCAARFIGSSGEVGPGLARQGKPAEINAPTLLPPRNSAQ